MNRSSKSLEFEAKPGAHDVSGLPSTYFDSEQINYRKMALFAAVAVVATVLIPIGRADNTKKFEKLNLTPPAQDFIPKTDQVPKFPGLPPLPPIEEIIPKLSQPNIDPRFILPPPTDLGRPSDSGQSA